MGKPKTACPRCRCTTVYRSHRRLYDLPMYLFGFRARRCTSCGFRFYRRHSSPETLQARVPSATLRRA